MIRLGDILWQGIKFVKEQKVKTYKTNALGFPIVILNPQFKTLAGQKVLDINFDDLARLAFNKVVEKPGRLTGGEIKFLRGYLNLSQSEFATVMGLKDHSPISRWEKHPTKPTKMSIHQEFTIRANALRLNKGKITNKFFEIFEVLKSTEDAGIEISIHAKDVA